MQHVQLLNFSFIVTEGFVTFIKLIGTFIGIHELLYSDMFGTQRMMSNTAIYKKGIVPYSSNNHYMFQISGFFTESLSNFRMVAKFQTFCSTSNSNIHKSND